MRKTFKKLLTVLFTGALLGTMLSGCGKVEDVTLTISVSGVDMAPFETRLRESHPEITLEHVSYNGYNQTGWIYEQLEAEMLEDIFITDTYLPANTQVENLLDLSRYPFSKEYAQGMLDACFIDGSVYMLPINFAPVGFYYNKDLIQSNGWDVPTNFEELCALVPKIQDAGLIPCVTSMGSGLETVNTFFGIGNPVFFASADGGNWKQEFITGESNASGKIEAALDYYKEWADAGLINADDANGDSYKKFENGEAVFMLSAGLKDITGKYSVLPWLNKGEGTPVMVGKVQKYVGINKHLYDKGNEAKLEAAINFMQELATAEGMMSINKDGLLSPLKNVKVDAATPYGDVMRYIINGGTVPYIDATWEEISDSLADELRALASGKKGSKDVAKAFDEIRNEWNATEDTVYGSVPKFLDAKKAAKIVGNSFLKGTDADCVLVSLGAWHGYNTDGSAKENPYGVQCGLYVGNVTLDRIKTFTPAGSYVIVEMSGAEINSMAERGLLLAGDDTPFEYALLTGYVMQLEDDKTYKLGISKGEVSEDVAKRALKEVPASDIANMIAEFISEIGTVTNENLK